MTQDRLPSLTETTWLWLKIGCLSFGGPAGQIAMMHRAVVEERQWLSDARFLHALNYCTLLPGPEAQQLATYIGWLMHGVRGGLIAGVLFVLPGALVMLALSVLYFLYAEVPAIQAVFYGLKAAVLAIVIEAVVRIGKRTLGRSWLIVIAGAAFTALFLFNAPFPWVVLGAGLLGLVAGLAGVSAKSGGNEGQGLQSGLVDRLITAGALPHTARNAGRTFLATLACLGAWTAPVALVFAITADGSVWRNLAVFFSQAAIVTFGGAYAVLP
ncbi:MAG TPA: chromate transporter, partial [Alphaproteobacteria bacterium]|nr:chromate transporter [Alphaproteobacteria bacterium]